MFTEPLRSNGRWLQSRRIATILYAKIFIIIIIIIKLENHMLRMPDNRSARAGETTSPE
jgi:hypothetical protein